MPTPGVYGIPLQQAFGLPNPPNPLRAYVRAKGQDNATSQGDTSIPATLDKAPLPGSIVLAAWDAEGPSPGVDHPDAYAITLTGFRGGCISQHGNLDANYPYTELWMFVPVAGVAPGTNLAYSGGGRGGWISLHGIEVPGIIGRMVSPPWHNWVNGSGYTTTGGVAPVDCLAVAWGAIDSGGAANYPVGGGWQGWHSASSPAPGGDGWIVAKPLPKGQTASVTVSSARSDFQVASIAYFI